jgi:hypothetical protein
VEEYPTPNTQYPMMKERKRWDLWDGCDLCAWKYQARGKEYPTPNTQYPIAKGRKRKVQRGIRKKWELWEQWELCAWQSQAKKKMLFNKQHSTSRRRGTNVQHRTFNVQC